MRYSADHKQLTRKKILDAAARRFRAEGYDGLGIDGLAKAAGVTNGAFYGHFESKADAFREVSVQGLVELREGIEQARAEHGNAWLAAFARQYLGPAKVDCPENTCALPSFAPEMARAPRETRIAFEVALKGVEHAMADGLAGTAQDARTKSAWAILALLAGGVTLVRSVDDSAIRETITAAILHAVERLADPA